ncbi:bifunctional phosphopantothenoylcysteine decarboxylase/phosphopantothenate--cysteine ligase CoaBC [Adlercreutzia sp. ZJ473]|uniref:bifunctional phosphopantothenoylcysteine decarboxylase/phosphopantothenate--cysteine ligase CoaBC n=1 Tax=Adlercreutzia sp. ZJ473 TaxID=2722822 RepID=UPI00155374A4|nr:bifunctional phosphopantothenoylcysteine decarboxylase/phosphopantothenate--cysteine ligase CoaBC [Adlercreutzia sp. ZJ473]
MSEPCVLVGVTGCIAAYKSCEVVRGLQKAGVRCKVVMTEHACEFVGPTTFRALTHEPVAVGLFDDASDPIHHVSLAQECDAFLIAPCTANVAAKIACGIADDLLTTTALATTSPLLIAPAMNVHMYEAAATQENLARLRGRGVRVIEAGEGYLACGDVGRGRLADVDVIVGATLDALREARATGATGGCEGAEPPACAAVGESAAPGASASAGPAASGAPARDLAGLRVMVTAGPTVEPLDAVRYLSNYSSGKMGYALAAAAAARGAQVTLVSGPVALEAPAGVDVIRVKTAREMLDAARAPFAGADIAVFTAAVADFRPARPADRKLKKGADDAALRAVELVENPDVLATLAREKRADQRVVGFAAETDDVLGNARRKLASKHADLVVANEVGEGRAFGTDDNKVWLVDAAGTRELPLMSKAALADAVLDAIVGLR